MISSFSAGKHSTIWTERLNPNDPINKKQINVKGKIIIWGGKRTLCTDFVWNSQNSIYLNVRESALPVWEDIVHMISEWYSRKDLGQAKVKANIYPLVVIIKMYNLLGIILHPVGFCWEEKYWHVFHITTMTTLRDSKVMEYIATQHFQLYTREKKTLYALP